MLSGHFSSLSNNVQAHVRSSGSVRRWERGQIVFQQHGHSEEIFLWLSGAVRLQEVDVYAGQERTVAIHWSGELIGTEALERTPPRRTLRADSLTDSKALVLSVTSVMRLMNQHPEFAEALSRAVAAQSVATLERNALMNEPVQVRLAHFLFSFPSAAQWDGEKPLVLNERISHQELAGVVGGSRETVTKTLGEMQHAGLISLGYRRIVLIDKEGLRAVVGG